MKYSAEERVKKAITMLDQAAEHNKVSKYWRNRIKVKDIRIANPDKGVLGQLFGTYAEGCKKIGLFGYYAGSALGFLHYPFPYRDNTRLLRQAWEKALRTDEVWKYDQLFNCYRRWIHGELYSIFPYVSGKGFQLIYTSAGNHHVGQTYKSLDSAKRAVRKLATK